MSKSGRFAERVIAPARSAGEPFFVALHVRSVDVRASGRPWSRSIAPGGSGRVGGAVTDDVRLSCPSEGASGLLGILDFPSVRVKAAPLRSALSCFARKPSGLDTALREVVMRGRGPLSACGKATSHVHVHHTAPQRRPRGNAAALGFSLVRSSRPRGARCHAAVPPRQRWSVGPHSPGRGTLRSDGSHRRLRLSHSLAAEPHGLCGSSDRSSELLVLRSASGTRYFGCSRGRRQSSGGPVGSGAPGGESGVAHCGTLREGGAVGSFGEADRRKLRSGSAIGAFGDVPGPTRAGGPASGGSRGVALVRVRVLR